MAMKEAMSTSDDDARSTIDDSREEEVKNTTILVNGPEGTASSAREEEVKNTTILVNGPEETASSAREKVRNFISLVNGLKDSVSSAWMALARYCPALLQLWRDKIIIYTFERWIVAFSLAAVYMFRAVYIGRLGIITYPSTFVLVPAFATYLHPKENHHDINSLPVYSSDEYRPLVRKVSEYGFWCFCMVIISTDLVLSFFIRLELEICPWYMQVIFFVVVCIVFLRRPIKFWRAYKFGPFNPRKLRHAGKKHASGCGSLADPEKSCAYHAQKI